jgi:hypothetical protein
VATSLGEFSYFTVCGPQFTLSAGLLSDFPPLDCEGYP